MPTFIWPAVLWGLLLLLLIGAAYLRAQRRRARYPLSLSTSNILRAVVTPSWWRRYLAPALFSIGIDAVVLAAARPMLPLPVPADRSAIIPAIDIGGSMRSLDIEPNRLEAAKRAARAFVEAVPDRIRIGLVAFAGYSTLLAAPTTDHQRLTDLADSRPDPARDGARPAPSAASKAGRGTHPTRGGGLPPRCPSPEGASSGRPDASCWLGRPAEPAERGQA